MPYSLVSLLGIPILIGVGWLSSTDRRRMNWRLIGWGLGLQLVFALFVFRVPAGRDFFVFVNGAVIKVLGAASHGSEFLFGRLAVGPGKTSVLGSGESLGFFLAFQVLPTIIFFSAVMAILYHLNVMPLLVRGFAWLFTRLMRLSGAESLCAASNIFVGVESALTVRPHLAGMTRSELCTVLTAGMATVASSVLVAYVTMLQDAFPNIAGHLISASILSAPAALVMSKVMLPETETPQTLGRHVRPHYDRDESLFVAIINGANAGLKLVAGITALLIAILGLVALVNLFVGAAGSRVNPLLGLEGTWSLEGLLGYVLTPFVLVTGVPPQDAGVIAKLVGERAILTEIPAYLHLKACMGTLQPRSVIIATYALCGFAHVASMAIFIGGITALAPGRAKALSAVGVRALAAATLACLLTACAAGVFLTGESVLLGTLPAAP